MHHESSSSHILYFLVHLFFFHRCKSLSVFCQRFRTLIMSSFSSSALFKIILQMVLRNLIQNFNLVWKWIRSQTPLRMKHNRHNKIPLTFVSYTYTCQLNHFFIAKLRSNQVNHTEVFSWIQLINCPCIRD